MLADEHSIHAVQIAHPTQLHMSHGGVTRPFVLAGVARAPYLTIRPSGSLPPLRRGCQTHPSSQPQGICNKAGTRGLHDTLSGSKSSLSCVRGKGESN